MILSNGPELSGLVPVMSRPRFVPSYRSLVLSTRGLDDDRPIGLRTRHTRAVMERHVFLIRAVNVGGTTLPMADLRAWATDLGASDVMTHLASGNLLCVPPGDPEDFASRLEVVIEDRLGVPREVIVRAADELRAALDAHPFPVIEARLSYVGFMTAAPTETAITEAEAFPTGDDAWRVIGRDLHMRFSRGAARPDMNVDRLLRLLARPVTMRNLRTVGALAERA